MFVLITKRKTICCTRSVLFRTSLYWKHGQENPSVASVRMNKVQVSMNNFPTFSLKMTELHAFFCASSHYNPKISAEKNLANTFRLLIFSGINFGRGWKFGLKIKVVFFKQEQFVRGYLSKLDIEIHLVKMLSLIHI